MKRLEKKERKRERDREREGERERERERERAKKERKMCAAVIFHVFMYVSPCCMCPFVYSKFSSTFLYLFPFSALSFLRLFVHATLHSILSVFLLFFYFVCLPCKSFSVMCLHSRRMSARLHVCPAAACV